MSAKINIRILARNHFNIVTTNDGKPSSVDWAVFLGGPATISVFVGLSGVSFSDNAMSGLLAGLAIFSGLLINVLVLLYSVNESTRQKIRNVESTDAYIPNQLQLHKEVLEETFANVGFSIIISFFCIVILCIMLVVQNRSGLFFLGLQSIFVLLVVHFILVVVMCVKRLYILISEDAQ